MNERVTSEDRIREAMITLRESQAELDLMVTALEDARRELERADQRLAAGLGSESWLRDTLVTLLPLVGPPCLLVDGELWVVACNDAGARALGVDPADAHGIPLSRCPRALERSRLARAALAAPVGPVEGEDGDRAVSWGIVDETVSPSERLVLLLLG